MCYDGQDRLTYFSWFSEFALYLDTQLIYSYFFQYMSEYDQAFDPNILIGHCDLISWFSDFVLYLDTQLVYFIFFQIMSMTRPLTPIYLKDTVT